MLPTTTPARAAKAGVRSRIKASRPTPAIGTISADRSAARALAWLATAHSSCIAREIPNRRASAAAASAMPGLRSGQGVKGASS